MKDVNFALLIDGAFYAHVHIDKRLHNHPSRIYPIFTLITCLLELERYIFKF